MKQNEIATALLNAAKETKQVFITKRNHMQLEECQGIFGRLCKIYASLGLPDTIVPYIEKLGGSATLDDEYRDTYIQALNHIIRETILYREYYCIIRRSDPVPGLASHIMTNLGQIVEALNEGYIPLIDMQFSENVFSVLNENHMVNVWELFFKQPIKGYNMSSIMESENCIVKDGIPGFMPYYQMDQLTNPFLVQFWKAAMREYMPFSDTMRQVVEEAYQQYGFKDKCVLGILCRGTDYITLRPHNHPVQPQTEIVIQKAKDMMKDYGCDYCYLATEDESVYSLFRKEFGERLIVSQSIYFKKEQQVLLSQTMSENPMRLYEKNLEYMISLFLLSRCQCLLAGRTSGAVVALLLNEKPYECMHFWNEGKYGVDDAQTLQTLTMV